MKRATSWLFRGRRAFFSLSSSPSRSPADKGYADFSIWNRSLLYRDALSGRPGSAETVIHLEAVQDITNYGAVSLWTDAIVCSGGTSGLSRISAGWSGFTYKGMGFGRRSRGFELRQHEPRIPLRQPVSSLRLLPGFFGRPVGAENFDLSAFGGKAARLSGLLGSSYEIKDQPLFGFKGRWKLGQGRSLARAVIHTRPDPSDLSRLSGPFSAKNTLVMARRRSPGRGRGENPRRVPDQLHPGGIPVARSGQFPPFRSVVPVRKMGRRGQLPLRGIPLSRMSTGEGQIVRDERGLFSSVRYQASRCLGLFAIADRWSNNTDRDPAANTSRAWSVISGFHFSTRSLLNLTAQWELQDRTNGKRSFGQDPLRLQRRFPPGQQNPRDLFPLPPDPTPGPPGKRSRPKRRHSSRPFTPASGR